MLSRCSFDQFFECFDGMRSSQSLLGSSGMWNWTCSVFSAITAASSLASGSSHFPVGMLLHVSLNVVCVNDQQKILFDNLDTCLTAGSISTYFDLTYS